MIIAMMLLINNCCTNSGSDNEGQKHIGVRNKKRHLKSLKDLLIFITIFFVIRYHVLRLIRLSKQVWREKLI